MLTGRQGGGKEAVGRLAQLAHALEKERGEEREGSHEKERKKCQELGRERRERGCLKGREVP